MHSSSIEHKDTMDTSGAHTVDDDFDIEVEEAIADRKGGKSKMNRSARDKKFGLGSGGRRSKQNTRSSTDSFSKTTSKKPGMSKSKTSQRPGKSRRAAKR